MKLHCALFISLVCSVAAADDAIPDYKAEKIAKHTWVIHGPLELPNAKNKGFMNNPAFVITDKSVVVFDPGSSRQAGEMVLRQIGKLTDNPVSHVFVTHIHGDHWLGNQAIKNAYLAAKLYAHPEMINQARAGEASYWTELMTRLTEGYTSDTKAIIPDTALHDRQEIKVDGLVLRIHLTGYAHTKTDAMIEITDDSVMVLGDNVVNQRIARMDDGSFRGNIKACNRIKATSAKIFIPGHGPSGDAASALSFCDYLSTLYTEVGNQVEASLSDFEMKPLVRKKLPAFEKWAGFEENFGRHVSLAVLEYEAASFE